MNRNTITAALAILLLAGGVVWLVAKRSGERGNARAAHEERAGATGQGERGAGKSKRSGERGALSPEQAARGIRDLLGEHSGQHGFPFSRVEALASRLSEADLRALMEEIGMDEEKGMEGWVRVALFAEWARRDPVAALAHADGLRKPDEVRDWPVQQATYGVLMGWASHDPHAALKALQRDEEKKGAAWNMDRYWEQHAYRQVFRELARRDAGAAWELLASAKNSPDAVRGFFSGLRTREELISYADRWAETWQEAPALNTPKIRSVRSLGFSESPLVSPGNQTAFDIAAALAAVDLEAAKQWIETAGPGDKFVRSGRWSNALSQWAAMHPGDALATLASGEYGHQETLARGIIRGDSSLAPEVVKELPAGAAQRLLSLELLGGGNYNVVDYFPGPGQDSWLVDFQASHDHLAAAVEAGNLGEFEEARLHALIERRFKDLLPDTGGGGARE